jgi:hypothetical protein
MSPDGMAAKTTVAKTGPQLTVLLVKKLRRPFVNGVTPPPAVRVYAKRKSPQAKRKTKSPEVIIAGTASGAITERKVRHSDAPST